MLDNPDILLLLSGLGCSVAGLALLYSAWKRQPSRHAAYVGSGWLLIFLATFFWIAATGWEFGLIYGITVPSIVAAVFVVANSDIRLADDGQRARLKLALPRVRQLGFHLKRFMLIGPFALIVSLLVTLGFALLLPMSQLNQGVLTVCLTPMIWGLTACWLATDAKPRRPVIALMSLSVAGSVPVVLGLLQ